MRCEYALIQLHLLVSVIWRISASEQCIPLKVPAKSTLICRTYNRNQECTLKCHSNAEFMAPLQERYAYVCGPDTQYLWTHELNNQTLPSCSGKHECN